MITIRLATSYEFGEEDCEQCPKEKAAPCAVVIDVSNAEPIYLCVNHALNCASKLAQVASEADTELQP